jgi:predicted permease
MSMPNEFRVSLRSLSRSPGFTLTAALLLTLGIGMTLYMAGAINGFVLRPLPFRSADRLVHVEQAAPELDEVSLEVPLSDYFAWRSELKSFEDLAAFYSGTLNFRDQGDPERLDGGFVSANLFDVLGARPQLGRVFTAEDERLDRPRAVVISGRLWERRFNGDPGVVGRPVRVNGQPGVVIGVMPRDFRFEQREEIWVPLRADDASASWKDAVGVEVIGHLAPGIDARAARAEFDGVIARTAEADSARPRGRISVVKTLAQEYVGRGTRRTLALMFIAVFLVFLIACVDVANLMLARGIARQRETAVRAALGASRRELAVRGLTEGGLVALVAAIAGMGLAEWAGERTMSYLRTSEDMNIPGWVNFGIDGRFIAATIGLAMLATLLAALGPALAASRADALATLRQTSRSAAGGAGVGRARRSLVVAQIALCAGVLTCAGLAIRGVQTLAAADLGVDQEKILGGRVALFDSAYPDNRRRLEFLERAEGSLAVLPGVAAAAVTTSIPGSFGPGARLEVEGGEVTGGRGRFAKAVAISPSYFEVVDKPLVAGRIFAPGDDGEHERVAIVNRLFVARLLDGKESVGRRFRALAEEGPGPWIRIVGVAPDLQQGNPDDPPAPVFYQPIRQQTPRFAFLALRSRGADAHAIAPAIQRVVSEIDPDQPIYFLRTVGDWLRLEEFGVRFTASLYSGFAAVALILAAVGVYALLAFAVSCRTAEIGVRRALGASAREIFRTVVGRSAVDLAIGLGAGAVLAALLARPLAEDFYGVRPFDPATWILVPSTLVVAALAAALVPTRRALAVDPAVALRNE